MIIKNQHAMMALHEYLLGKIETATIDTYDYYKGQLHFAYAIDIINEEQKDKLSQILEERRHVF